MQKTATFLMFVGKQAGNAEQAVKFYTSLFSDSRILSIDRWLDGEPGGIPGQVKLARFELAGQTYMASENAMEHPFSFTPAISIFVECEDESEIQELYEHLKTDGQTLMPLEDYGFSRAFAWVEDRFGVSWQLNLSPPTH